MAKLSAQSNTEAVFRQLVRNSLEQISEYEDGAKRRDAEALHKMRVGVRRLRSVFTTFKAALDPNRVGDLRSELRWLQGILGDCRDWDVFNHKNTDVMVERLPEYHNIKIMARHGHAARERAYDILAQTIDSNNYRMIREAVEHIAAPSPVGPSEVGTAWMARPIKKFADRTLKKHQKKVRKLGRRLDKLQIGEMHEFRKQIKKLRYAIEFLASLYRKKRVNKRVEQLTLMQDLIGQMVDVRAGQALIDKLEPPPDDGSLVRDARLIVTGWMAANSADCSNQLRDAWQKYEALKPLR